MPRKYIIYWHFVVVVIVIVVVVVIIVVIVQFLGGAPLPPFCPSTLPK
jgi:hypothetical protein